MGGIERNKVVVTGLGEITPLGGDVASSWKAILRGESGVGLLDDETWARKLPTMLAARIQAEPNAVLEPMIHRKLGRTARLAVAAAHEAWKDAGLEDERVSPDRLAVVVSSASADITATVDAWEALKDRGWRRVPPTSIPMLMANAPAAAVSLLVHAQGGAHATVSACSSGTQALATAADLIRRGFADVILAGGAEAPVHPFFISSFSAMRALSRRVDDPSAASRPFDAERDGMVLGEGAGIVVLESDIHARQRGARIYAELAGVGIASDACHIVQPESSGVGSAAAMRASLNDAGVAPANVSHVNAAGVSTVISDAAEAQAIQAVFGDASRGPMLSANKSMLGHSLGASGAIESVATILSVYHRVVPPTRNFTRSDEGVSIDVVHDVPRELTGKQIVAVKNSSGFGGHNVALTFRSADV
jgi:3-oxoacyl-[acyl-carrier-protein] synthase II